jgi:hypothetical protein
MLASSPVRGSNPARPRQFAGAALLAFIALVFFALVVAALAIRNNGVRSAQDAAILTGIAPYAIALAVAHGIVAHFAMSANPLARRVALVFAAAGVIVAGIGAAAVWSGFDPFARPGPHPIAYDGIAIMLVIAILYGVAAVLLWEGEPRHHDD